ncbi:hypothetical protein GCM10011521_24440 [Arenimonas soli]|uniref:Glycosyltransferase 2-like domain-containing protein n=1 Tax=Arenimonas soli TaxID=2269504 RepID=A0ABQ1HPB6_9GAMM|nr:glycosyltransferase family A protein [Arenimonas soli]GGA85111.1 hypothetical protein GCM10011521_24440 [Arenimonas soli]
MTERSTPLVSIGVAIYNESAYIDQTLRSLRAQDYPRLEIVVCDNASTDATLDICRAHAAEDPRIRIEPASSNLGATANFRRAVDLGTGDYFMWAAGHDLWTPGLVSECVHLLESHPEASLAFASSRWMGPDGEPLPRETGWTDTRGLGPAGRFFSVLWGNMHPVMGLIRRDRLVACGPLPGIVGGDLVLLSALALRGDFLHAPGSTWSRRDQRIEQSYRQKLRRYTSSESGVTQSRLDRMFPLLALPLALSRLVLRSKQPLGDRLVMFAALVPSLLLRLMVGRRAPRA